MRKLLQQFRIPCRPGKEGWIRKNENETCYKKVVASLEIVEVNSARILRGNLNVKRFFFPRSDSI